MYFFATLTSLPVLIGCVVGLILVRQRRGSLPQRTVTLASLGLAVTLLATVLGMVWQLAIVWLYQLDRSLFTVASTAQWVLTAGLSTAGLGLLVAAVLSRGTPQHPWAAADPYRFPQPPVNQ